MSKFRLAVMLPLLCLVPHGGGAAEKSKAKPTPASAGKSGLVTPALAPVQHKILAEDRSNPERRVLTIGIDRRASTLELTTIARGLFKPPAGSRETALINFQLENDRGSDAVWAVARVGSDVKVQFIGLSPDEITQLRAEAANDTRKVVGSWLTQPPLSAGRITIYRDGTAPMLEWRLRGGTKTTVEMIETQQQGSTAYIDKAGGAEHFVLNANGDLDVRDGGLNLVAIAEKIEAFAPAKPTALTSLATLRQRSVIYRPTSATLLEPPPPPSNKPTPTIISKRYLYEPTWEVRIRP